MSEKAKTANNQRSRIAIFGICSFLALVLCTGVVVGVAISMITEGVYDFGAEEQKPSATPLPQTDEDAVAYLGSLLEKATDDTRVYLRSMTSVSVDESTIKFRGTEHELNALMYMKNNIYSSIDEIYPENYNGSFGDGFKDYPLLSLGDEYTRAECKRGAEGDNGEIYDEDYYFINITVPGGEFPAREGTGVYQTYSLQDSVAIAQEIKSIVSPVIIVDRAEIVPEDFTIEAKANCLNDEICYADFIRFYKVSLSLTFTGEYSGLGSRTLSFNYRVSERYEYTWAGLSFSEETVYIERKVSHALPLRAVMNDDSEYTVTFKSSDESIATVDELGYVYGLKHSKEPVTITAHINYLGHDYTAECKVYVTVAVEKIKISDDEMSLAVGESGTLSAKLEPRDATIDDIIWISEDESTATVTQDGRVTAIKAGVTKIIAVSADGFFRDSCVLTVTD